MHPRLAAENIVIKVLGDRNRLAPVEISLRDTNWVRKKKIYERIDFRKVTSIKEKMKFHRTDRENHG